jgi:hypothetical protein
MNAMENNEEKSWWLSWIDQYYSTQNAFQKEVSKGIREYDRFLTSDPDYFRILMQESINTIHKDHKRCGAITVEPGFNGPNSKDVSWRIGSSSQCIVTMKLLHVEGLQLVARQADVPEPVTFEKPAVININADWNDEHLDADPYA